jgi:hypothetical protein
MNNYINDKYKSLDDNLNGLEYAYTTIKYYYDINNNIIDQEEYNELNDTKDLPSPYMNGNLVK